MASAGQRVTAVGISGLSKEGKITVVTINDTTWTALPVTPLDDRNALSIQNPTEENMKINYADDIVGYVGIEIKAGFERYYDIKDSIGIYGKSESGDIDVIIEELA